MKKSEENDDGDRMKLVACDEEGTSQVPLNLSRQHDMQNWLRHRQRHPTLDGAMDTPPILNRAPDHSTSPQIISNAKLISHYSKEYEGRVREEQREASEFIASFLRDAATATYGMKEQFSHASPIKTKHLGNDNSNSSIHQRKYSNKKSSNKKLKQREDDRSESSSIGSQASLDNLSECLKELARTRAHLLDAASTDGEDDKSLLSNLSEDYVGMGELLHHRSDEYHGEKDERLCRREDTKESKSTSTNMSSLVRPAKPILKKKHYDAKITAENVALEKIFDDDAALGDLLGYAAEESDDSDEVSNCINLDEGIISQPKHRCKRLSSSMGDIGSMTKNIHSDDEAIQSKSFGAEPEQHSANATLKERSYSDKSRRERMKEKKAEAHTRALRGSGQSASNNAMAMQNEQLPRARSKSYDDEDRFLRSLEEASAALQKEKTYKMNLPDSTSQSSRRLRGDDDVKSLDAFDDMLAEIEEEERMMESVLFGENRHSGGENTKRSQSPTTNNSVSTSSSVGSLAINNTNVICSKWIDRRGMPGHYSGEVNLQMQPHGKGTLVYENGMVLDCNWSNGVPSVGTTDVKVATNGKNNSPTPMKKGSQHVHPGYNLGMTAKSGHDMREEDPDKAIVEISHLEPLDFAFVRRTNRQWTYSIICDRTDESIRFVIDEVGRTKTIRKEHWLKNIRLVDKQKRKSRHHRSDRHEIVCKDRKKLEP